jgi:hypothetical protein
VPNLGIMAAGIEVLAPLKWGSTIEWVVCA